MAKYLDYDGMLYFWSKLKEKFSSIGSAFTPKGSSSTIPSLTSSNIGDVYNMSSEFTTTSDFVEGDGITYPVGTNIICVNSSGTKKWDVLSGFVNLSGYSKTDHNHNGVYSPVGHTHSDYVTSQYLGQNYYSKTQIDDGFSPIGHSHNNASDKSAGFIKVSSVNTTTVTVNAESTTAGRYYPVELNGDGKAIVNIPWVDTTYSAATTSSNGLMSSTDKNKLNGIATGATADTAITNSEIDTILAS